MMQTMYYLICILGMCVFILAAVTIRQKIDINRLKRNGYRKVGITKRNRAFIAPEFLVGLTELGFIILMLISIFGWMSMKQPSW